jgi:formylglycine-generating enzyme required for sulfatase activity
MEFARVPGGCFRMGSAEENIEEEFLHEVCVDGFWIGRYEVTQGQWQQLTGNNPSQHQRGPDYPVEKVSYPDVQKFITTLSERVGIDLRLPTEAEWEYACRSGGKQEEYAGGPAEEVAWFDRNSGFHSRPVGKKRPNGLGLYDMSGNVWEWTQDRYAEDAYLHHSHHNPINQRPGYRFAYVARGGSWGNYGTSARCAFRVDRKPESRYNNLGFRLVAEFKSEETGVGKDRN